MKIVIAPDSFKGCLRSPKVCEALKSGILEADPSAEVICVPMADGGEGTVEAAVAATGGKIRKIEVPGPLGKSVVAEFGILGGQSTAIMEMASASGIELLSKEELNPLKTSTYGTGELLREILATDIRRIIIGIGGSATVDGGSGMASSLGYRFLDKEERELPKHCAGGDLDRLFSIDALNALPGIREVEIITACDVTNPLLGKNGAARVFGPQKGATPEMVEMLEKNLANYASVLMREGFLETVDNPGDGAAGGLGAGLRAFCGARVESGAQLMMKVSGLERHLDDADLLITGEGCTDSQTGAGKLCSVLAHAAREKNVPVVLVSGALKGDADSLLKIFAAAYSITRGPCSLEEAIDSAEENLYLAGKNIAGLLKSFR
ncbi:MAG: hypothetical protein A2020_14190 [Lentisphaerae bacterium GWF2_45_14]|nr:MAG: hypothetical protein A2020_14190 [Lentisphaerae bacterium GWF2_45_14]